MEEKATTEQQLNRVLQCPRLNKAKMICITPNCTEPALTCLREECQFCVHAHKKCCVYRTDVLIEKVLQKKQSLNLQITEAIQAMEKVYDEAIDRLSKDKDYTISQIDYYGFNQHQVEFVRSINDGAQNQLTGSVTSKVFENITVFRNWEATAKTVENFWESKSRAFNQIFDRLKKVTAIKGVYIESKIIEDTQDLIELFGDDTVIGSLQLVFRASEHGFLGSQFHKSCDSMKDTLVIIKTVFGKILGGYTPLPWNQRGEYIADYQLKSFLFSLTHKQRYDLLEPQHAICGQNGGGPCFGGGHDIYITDNCNLPQSGSYFNFPSSYGNSKLTNGAQSYRRFAGNTNGSYQASIEQYEVYKVHFQ